MLFDTVTCYHSGRWSLIIQREGEIDRLERGKIERGGCVERWIDRPHQKKTKGEGRWKKKGLTPHMYQYLSAVGSPTVKSGGPVTERLLVP